MVYSHFVLFDWDDSKAATAFSDSNAIEFLDGSNSEKEDRWIPVGLSTKSQVLLVVFVEIEEKVIRIVSARKAVKEEINRYFSRIKI